MKYYNVDVFRKPAKGKKPDKKVTHCKLCLRAVSGRQKSRVRRQIGGRRGLEGGGMGETT